MWRKKANFTLQESRHSKKGIISMICGILVIGIFIASSVISSLAKGNGSLLVGLLGMVAFVAAIYGFIVGIKSFREKDIFYVAPIVGVGSNGVMLVTLFCLYIVGIIL